MIVITGIIGAIVAVFLRGPVQGYFDSVRRAQLTDTADTALRRITRDLRLALPNSVRLTVAGGVSYLELLQVSGGGRYRAAPDAGGSGDALDFTLADTGFDVLGPMPPALAGQFVVVANLGASGGADAYAGTNRAVITAAGPASLSIAATRFPVESPGRRFHVVSGAVTYVCDPGAGTLQRIHGYAIAAAQATPPAAGTNVLLADRVALCQISIDPVPATRSAVVSLQLALSADGETVSLFQQAHVSNVP